MVYVLQPDCKVVMQADLQYCLCTVMADGAQKAYGDNHTVIAASLQMWKWEMWERGAAYISAGCYGQADNVCTMCAMDGNRIWADEESGLRFA